MARLRSGILDGLVSALNLALCPWVQTQFTEVRKAISFP
jgi:hypothetical protein